MARPSDYVTSFGLRRTGEVSSNGDAAPIRLEALERRRIAREKLTASSVIPGTFFRVDRAWYRVIEKLTSHHGNRWKVQDVLAPDSPMSVVAWTEVGFVSAATSDPS